VQIATDKVGLDERRRSEALRKISHETRFGTVDGVEFDLRHAELAPTEWVMEYMGNRSHNKMRRPSMPFIWYPWDGTFDEQGVTLTDNE